MPLVLGRASDDRLRTLVASAESADYSYAEVGATRRLVDEPPAGYRISKFSREITSGDADSQRVFEKAVEALQSWVAHRGAGARVLPEAAPVAEGQTVVVALALGPITLVAPCRIVYVVDEPNRFGFAYGTLVGHPERGEEQFYVERGDGGVRVGIVAFSRPVHPLARLGTPVANYFQNKVNNRYLDAVRHFALS